MLLNCCLELQYNFIISKRCLSRSVETDVGSLRFSLSLMGECDNDNDGAGNST